MNGVIAERYNQTGGASGPLGPVISNQTPAADGRGQYNLFKNGMIAWSSPTGPKSMQVVYRVGHKVTFQWGPTDPFGYDRFIVRWTINKGAAKQVDVNGQGIGDETFSAKSSRTDGNFTLTLDPKDSVSFIVEGADKGTFGTVARQGWSTPVWVGAPPDSPQPPVVPPAISVTSSGANAASVFTVTGSGFKPSAIVNVRVVDDLVNTQYYSTTASKIGQLQLQQAIPCNGGYFLHFSATDGRSNPQDATGNLWSNTFNILCPGEGAGGGGAVDTQSTHHKPGKKLGALTGMKAISQKKVSETTRLEDLAHRKTKP